MDDTTRSRHHQASEKEKMKRWWLFFLVLVPAAEAFYFVGRLSRLPPLFASSLADMNDETKSTATPPPPPSPEVEEASSSSSEESPEALPLGPRDLFRSEPMTMEKGPPGTLAASILPDYTEWISSQLRINRVQACSDLIKTDLVEKLRRLDYDKDLAEDLKELVATNNGVFDKSASTLLSGTWDEVYPASRVGGSRRAAFKIDDKVVVRFERQLLGPLLGFVRVFDGFKSDVQTLGLRRRKFGGLQMRLFGLTLPLPWIFRGYTQKSLTFLYVDSDLLIFKDQNGQKLSVLAPPLERSLFNSLLYVARRYQTSKRRRQLSETYKPESQRTDVERGPPIGDLVWQADTSMEVNDEDMQEFLDKPLLRANFSVQDMLDGNFRVDDGDIEAKKLLLAQRALPRALPVPPAPRRTTDPTSSSKAKDDDEAPATGNKSPPPPFPKKNTRRGSPPPRRRLGG